MSQRDGRGLRGWVSNAFGTLAGLAVMGLVLAMTAWGGYTVWVQLSGTPAQVEIEQEHCYVPQRSGHYESCTGEWRQTDGTQKTVTVYGSNIAESRTVDVHIRGDTGFTNSFAGWIVLLVGMGIIGLFLFAMWVGRRYRRASKF